MRWRRKEIQLRRLLPNGKHYCIFIGNWPAILNWLDKHPKILRNRMWIEDIACPARVLKR